MDVNNVNNENNTYFFNPNTGQATSSNKNTIPFDREALKAMSKKLNPVESLTGAFKSLPSSSYVNRSNNSISFAAGSTISLNGGYRLVLSAETGFQLSGELGDERYFEEACSMRGAMNRLLKNAEKDTTLGISDNLRGGYSKWESNITKILSKYGIDTTKDFTFNGMKFTRGNDGQLISQRESDARIAYDMQTANNRTYSLADDRTKKEVQYKSRYYLQSVPNQVRDIWNEILDETGANPFVNKYGNTLALLAVEQDFATGGNDQLFGDSVESAIEATKKILDRIDNPLQSVPDTDRDIYEKVSQRERNFYSTLLDEQYLTVRRSVRRNSSRKKVELGATKRKKVRTVDFGDTLTAILKKAKKAQLKNRMPYGTLGYRNYYKEVVEKNRTHYELYALQKTEDVPEDYHEIDFVCTKLDGSYVSSEQVAAMCRSAARKIDGLAGFHFHCLRHSYTSNLIANGASPKDVQELLGHSDVSTTMNVYAHSSREAKRSSARLLDKVAGID